MLVLNKENTRLMIEKMTVEYKNRGGVVKKIPSSKTQYKYVKNTHGFVSGRVGWFEMK